MDESTVNSLKARSIYAFPVGGYTDENGTVNRIPFPIPDNLAEQHQAFRAAELSKIVTEKADVTRISEQNLTTLDYYNRYIVLPATSLTNAHSIVHS